MRKTIKIQNSSVKGGLNSRYLNKHNIFLRLIYFQYRPFGLRFYPC